MLNQHYWTTHQEKARSLLCQGSGAVEHIGIKHKNHFHPDKHLIMKYMKDAEDDYMMTVTTICGPATVSSWSSYSILNTRSDLSLKWRQRWRLKQIELGNQLSDPPGNRTSTHPQQILQVYIWRWYMTNMTNMTNLDCTSRAQNI